MNIGFGLGAAYILSFLALAPGGDPVLATLVTALMFVPLGVIYAIMLAALPRSGTDYVFISRSIHPAVGYIMNFTGTVWFFFWTGAFVNWIFAVGLGPALSLIGWVQNDAGISAMASAVTSSDFVIGAGIALLVILGIITTVRKRILFKIITVSLIAGVISVALMMMLLASSSNSDFISRFNLFSAPFAGNPDYHHQVISTANMFSTFSWQQTSYLIPVATWTFM
jgi:APA family basic amino acid/polyamine antiporter